MHVWHCIVIKCAVKCRFRFAGYLNNQQCPACCARAIDLPVLIVEAMCAKQDLEATPRRSKKRVIVRPHAIETRRRRGYACDMHATNKDECTSQYWQGHTILAGKHYFHTFAQTASSSLSHCRRRGCSDPDRDAAGFASHARDANPSYPLCNIARKYECK